MAASLGHQLTLESKVVEPCMDGDGNVSHDFLGNRCMRCKLVLT